MLNRKIRARNPQLLIAEDRCTTFKMNIIKKIVFTILILFGLFLVWFFIGLNEDNREESKFYNIEIPKKFEFDKPIEFLSNNQVDSLESINLNEEKILVIGDGYSGYDFYIWHKPVEKGELYIKAFELTQNVELSKTTLRDKTEIEITELGENHNLYVRNSLIYEGTFSNYYPVRFELWFKSKNQETEKKLTEKNYLIDGWDR